MIPVSQDLGLCVATCGSSEINSTFYVNLAHLFDLLTAFLYDVSEYHQSFCPYRLFSGRKYYISWKQQKQQKQLNFFPDY